MIFKAALASQSRSSCPYKPLIFQILNHPQFLINFQSSRFKSSVSGEKKCSSIWSYDKNISTFWQKHTFKRIQKCELMKALAPMWATQLNLWDVINVIKMFVYLKLWQKHQYFLTKTYLYKNSKMWVDEGLGPNVGHASGSLGCYCWHNSKTNRAIFDNICTVTQIRAVGTVRGGGGHCVSKWGFMRTFPRNQDATLK